MFSQIEQEQINNIPEHAYAARAVISLKKETDNHALVISDNGTGFDITQLAKNISLKNIQSRVVFYSGTMKIISALLSQYNRNFCPLLKTDQYEKNYYRNCR